MPYSNLILLLAEIPEWSTVQRSSSALLRKQQWMLVAWPNLELIFDLWKHFFAPLKKVIGRSAGSTEMWHIKISKHYASGKIYYLILVLVLFPSVESIPQGPLLAFLQPNSSNESRFHVEWAPTRILPSEVFFFLIIAYKHQWSLYISQHIKCHAI